MNKTIILLTIFLSCFAFATEQTTTATDNVVGIETDKPSIGIDLSRLAAVAAEPTIRTLGSIQKDDGYKFELHLTGKAASIEYARLTDYYERGSEDEPMLILAPIMNSNKENVLSLANGFLSFEGFEGRFPLQRLNWHAGYTQTTSQGQSLSFTTNLSAPDYGDVLRLVKTYEVVKESRHLYINLAIENLTDENLTVNFELQSPVGYTREEIRTDMRDITAAFSSPEGMIKSTRVDFNKIRKAVVDYHQSLDPSKLAKAYIEIPKGTNMLEWVSTGNKYFAAILQPQNNTLDNPRLSRGEYYDSKMIAGLSVKQQPPTDGKSEGIGYKLTYSSIKLAAKTTEKFDYMLYLGPKDKSLFEKNELYSQLGFVHSINFQACCGNLFRPISFFILALMKTVHYVIPNYGVIIILLVLLVRTLLHPLTKKGQISMMKMGKLGPKVEEIKKKYGDNPTEMNKRVMQMYKEQGANPMLGFLPMLIQMPIWISLYSAINASIDLRGAKFLPFWITDLSAPDMLFTFSTITIPLVGWNIDSFNLLPILLAIGMVLQQKLMSPAQNAAMNPQMAQQQKMMLIMMPAMMLIFLYTAPSGLNLYIMASTFGGIIEQKVIKKHIQEQEDKEKYGKVPVTAKTGGKLKKKKPKPMFKN